MPASSDRVPDHVTPLTPKTIHVQASNVRMVDSALCRRTVSAKLYVLELSVAFATACGGTHLDAELLRPSRELHASNAIWFALLLGYEVSSRPEPNSGVEHSVGVMAGVAAVASELSEIEKLSEAMCRTTRLGPDLTCPTFQEGLTQAGNLWLAGKGTAP